MRNVSIRYGLLAVLGLLFCSDAVWAQRLDFIMTVETSDGATHAISGPTTVRRGTVVKLIAASKMKAGHHSYAITAADNNGASFTVEPNDAFSLFKKPIVKESPEPASLKQDGLKRLHYGPFVWEYELLVKPEAKPGTTELKAKIFTLVCTNTSPEICSPKDLVFSVPFQISDEDPLPLTESVKARIGNAEVPVIGADQNTIAPKGKKEENKEIIFGLIDVSQSEYKKAVAAIAARTINDQITDVNPAADLWAFILGGIFWGAISLVTPCVFPMIPITVSIFLKQSEKEHHRPVVMASVYSGTIIVVLTLAAAFMLEVFRFLSVNPVMNYALGALFVFFALSLFGMYEIELPSGLARFTSAHEEKGGIVGTMFMALTFTIISFACVAPFLGGFGGTAAGVSRPLWVNLLGGLAFSATFAAPFFFLALFPTLLRKLPKSGSWLNSVKVVMGFLELAAAVKFCRAAELVLTPEPWLLTFDVAMGVYVALAVFAGLYLLGLFRLPHDSPEEHLTVPRMVFAGGFIALALYLAPALMKNSEGDNIRPRGTIYSWVESFLLPDANDSPSNEPHTANLDFAVKKSLEQHKQAMEKYNKDLEKAVDDRDKKKKPPRPQRIFVDFTGVTCTNCQINEKSVFSKHYIRQMLEQYIIVKLYCDVVPSQYYNEDERANMTNARQTADARKVNLEFEKKIFDNEQLPLYAILEPQQNGDIRVIDVYDEGRINNEKAFADFLRQKKRAD